MRKLILALAAVAALAACQQQQETKTEDTPPPATEQGRAMTDPAAVVRQIYDPYLVEDETTPPLEEVAPWSAQMTADIAAMRGRTQAGDAPALDFDPIIDAQDYRVSNVTTSTEAVAEASHAVVRAHFTNLGHDQEVIYDLVWQDDRWKVDNIRTAQWDMRRVVTGS